MTARIAATLTTRLAALPAHARGRGEAGQSTVEYVGLAMAVGVLLLAVGSYLGGKDHGIGSTVTAAIKSAIQHAGAGK
jgi:Flp pilus assembly pilin Flp